jgi:hypothetical protein
MNTALHFSSATPHWATPLAIYEELNTEFKFTLDPCPLGGSLDGLSESVVWRGERVYCNPPYGRGLAKWLKRGLEAEIAVFLLPARTDTAWFHELCLPYASEIRFIKGRLKFGIAIHNAPFPSMVVVFENRKVMI